MIQQRNFPPKIASQENNGKMCFFSLQGGGSQVFVISLQTNAGLNRHFFVRVQYKRWHIRAFSSLPRQ